MGLRRPKSNKNPPVFSHEFVIQNHADIVSCVAMVFVIGLMFQATNPVASLFVAMQHNVTLNQTERPDTSYYTCGMKDFFAIFFYMLICIVSHAVIQEYILDKVNRKMHLSKIKHSKFNESGQLLTFYLVSAIWGADIIIKRKLVFTENYALNIGSLWEGYPHANLPFILKFFFILQLAYWLHTFPELYFQKIKKDEVAARVQYAVLYFVFIGAAYLLNFTRVALCIMVLHYTVEFGFHLSRLLYFADKTEFANTGFMIWNVLFVLIRLGTITLAVLTFWYGLEQSGRSTVDIAEGNYNTQIIRINCLAAVCLLQAWMMWNFITFHLKRMRERSNAAGGSKRFVTPSKKSKKSAKAKAEDSNDVAESSNGQEQAPGTPPAVENGSVRQRTPRSKKSH